MQSRPGRMGHDFASRSLSPFSAWCWRCPGWWWPGYIQADFKGDTMLSGAVGVLVPGVLMLSAFYMAVRFLRFAATGKK